MMFKIYIVNQCKIQLFNKKKIEKDFSHIYLLLNINKDINICSNAMCKLTEPMRFT